MALEIDEDEDNVSVTVNYLMSKGVLVSASSSEYELTTCHEMAGSETDSARRMRLMRGRQNEQSGALSSHCDSDVTKCDTEKEIRVRDRDIHTSAGKPPVCVDFEKFWSAYPKKVGKKSAKKAFDRAKMPVETLLSAIERQKCSTQWSKDNGQFIPNPTTWLNQGRWEDEITPVTTGSGSHQGEPDGLVLVDDGNGGMIWRYKD